MLEIELLPDPGAEYCCDDGDNVALISGDGFVTFEPRYRFALVPFVVVATHSSTMRCAVVGLLLDTKTGFELLPVDVAHVLFCDDYR